MSDDKQLKKFKKLEEEWRSEMLSRNDTDVETAIRDSAMNLVTLEMAKEFDEDLNSLREQLKTAQETYTEGKKINLLKIEFLAEVLRSRGRTDIPAIDDFIKGSKKQAVLEKVGETLQEIGSTLKGGETMSISIKGSAFKEIKKVSEKLKAAE